MTIAAHALSTTPRFSLRRVDLAIEGAFIFFALPLAFALGYIALPQGIAQNFLGFYLAIPLLAGAGVCVILLLRDPEFDRTQLWNPGGLRFRLRFIIVMAPILAVTYAALIYVISPEDLFSIIRHDPRRWAVLILLYPFVSVYPQEIIYRTFVFHRYRPLFSHPSSLVVWSALVFGLVHAVFLSWIAVCTGLVGGAFFAYTYYTTRSTLAVAVEHTVYGWIMLTIT